MSVINNDFDFSPLIEYLTKEIRPNELLESIECIEHELSIAMLRNPENITSAVISGISNIYSLKQVLKLCIKTTVLLPEH